MKLSIACIQMDIAFGNPDQNYQSAKQLIADAAELKPDIIVLPELWTTGYDLSRLDVIGDQDANKTKSFLKNAALQHGTAFVGGSVAKKTAEGIFNTLIIVDKHGEAVHEYSKLHLFQLMDEHLYLSAGNSKGLFTLENRLLSGMICYDIRFPEWIRAHTAQGAEALFVVAEWPLARLAHWRALLISRAIENQCYVIACNRAGSDPKNAFAGHSMIIDPWGEIIAEAGEDQEILHAEIDLDEVRRVREIIPIFSDRKPEFYN
ncbi:carbon-nitrogen hydrolase [Bacillus canaveralius]|uniref:Carbon-nitrogen hydrolase n=1 Tax=Bacillus canaveralius TaxID=1403243 RepID=A0A2N5GKW4_9BACI|nr:MULTISPECIES: carbon-nitrogen family hydrolase [Bacillus]PLR82151.1 carbon-nitrogen hydrolase [Bacillus canaveralius]PLR83979.1 carbon-nitrogen hydrolase [Bacillus sp. V33-4]PLR97943.1 carbon-nitrogen hydrolase [Bacillus canaveralius]RSK52346.1 carbon-nitrogen family hydrolase [Bacillus canaveralius]